MIFRPDSRQFSSLSGFSEICGNTEFDRLLTTDLTTAAAPLFQSAPRRGRVRRTGAMPAVLRSTTAPAPAAAPAGAAAAPTFPGAGTWRRRGIDDAGGRGDRDAHARAGERSNRNIGARYSEWETTAFMATDAYCSVLTLLLSIVGRAVQVGSIKTRVDESESTYVLALEATFGTSTI
jgi:hypothetical protein